MSSRHTQYCAHPKTIHSWIPAQMAQPTRLAAHAVAHAAADVALTPRPSRQPVKHPPQESRLGEGQAQLHFLIVAFIALWMSRFDKVTGWMRASSWFEAGRSSSAPVTLLRFVA